MLPTFVNPRAGRASAARASGGYRGGDPVDSGGKGKGSRRASRRDSDPEAETIGTHGRESSSHSSIPELPALTSPSKANTSKVTLSTVIKIGAHSYTVPAADLKNLYLHFRSLDEDGTGKISWTKMQASQGGGSVFSKKTLESKAATTTFKRRASMAQRVEDGEFNFPDLLRIRYPMAGKDDIKLMEQIAKELCGVRVKSRNYPKPRRDAASRHFQRICDVKGRVDMDMLEDFLIQRWPDSNHYDLLKTFDPSVLDALYNEESIDEEEFCMWYLKLEDMIEFPEGQPEKKGKKGSKTSKAPVKRTADASSVYSSYLDSRATRNSAMF